MIMCCTDHIQTFQFLFTVTAQQQLCTAVVWVISYRWHCPSVCHTWVLCQDKCTYERVVSSQVSQGTLVLRDHIAISTELQDCNQKLLSYISQLDVLLHSKLSPPPRMKCWAWHFIRHSWDSHRTLTSINIPEPSDQPSCLREKDTVQTCSLLILNNLL